MGEEEMEGPVDMPVLVVVVMLPSAMVDQGESAYDTFHPVVPLENVVLGE